MPMYSYDQVLTDVRQVYEQLTGLPAPKIDTKNPRFTLPAGADSASLVQSEINYLNLFLINSGLSLRLSRTPTWAPPAEVYETPRDYVVLLEVPGLAEEDFSVHVINNTLIVRGARKFRRPGEECQYHSSERAYGTFERLFPLPNYVQSEKLKTKLVNGILEINLTTTTAGHESRGRSSTSEEKSGGKK